MTSTKKPAALKKQHKPAAEKPIKVSLFLSPDIHHKAKIAAATEDLSLYEWIAKRLAEHFGRMDKKATKRAA